MRKVTFVFFSFFLANIAVFSQVSLHNFEYVNLPLNAHVAGVGGVNVSVPELNMVFQNPALIHSDMSKIISISYNPYFSDIKSSSVSYIHNFNKTRPVAMGLQYFSGGKITQTDEAGNDMGTFTANQYLLQAGSSHKVNNFTLGVNLKFAGSNIGTYNSYAFLSDIGGIFKHPKRNWTIGIVAKNAGFALKKYKANEPMSMPFDLQIGTSYKLEHMPFRFSILAHHLQKFDIVYLDTTQTIGLDDKGNPIKPTKSFGDKLARHFIIGGEFFIGKAFTVRFGYNYLRRKELKMENKPGLAGFSFGAALKIKSFEFAFTQAYYSSAGGSSFLTLNTSLNTLFKKKSPPEQSL